MHELETAKAELLQARDRLIALVDATPDDRLAWRPSESARSIVEVAAHCGHALGNILIQMKGTPYPIPSSGEAEIVFQEHDRQFTGREVVPYFAKHVDDFVAYLDALTEADLDRRTTMPFGLGEVPLRVFVFAGANHTNGHIAQIEYIQTIYGDRDWHTGF